MPCTRLGRLGVDSAAQPCSHRAATPLSRHSSTVPRSPPSVSPSSVSFVPLLTCTRARSHLQADAEINQTDEEIAALKKKRTFRKFTFRGTDLDALLDMTTEQLMDIVHARARRRFSRGLLLKRPVKQLKAKLLKAKKECGPYDKPEVVKTHLRDMIVIPEMIGSVVGVHNGKVFTTVEVKADMVGHYLGEFSITYKPVRHGRPGIGATSSSKFIPLK